LSSSRSEDESRQRVASFLETARLEVIPMKGIDDRVHNLPPNATVTVTCSPTRGLEPTLRLTERLVSAGHHAVPHVSARLIESREHLQTILTRLKHCGVSEAFVIGGDARKAAGPFDSAASLLHEMATMQHSIVRIGVAAYPERHPFVGGNELLRALLEKQPHAHYIVNQICFDASLIRRWLDGARANGVSLPLYIGFPGVVSTKRLMAIALRIGVGDSARFLGGHVGTVTKLARSSRYSPETLLANLAPWLGESGHGIEGFHINTFNEIESTEEWRAQALKSAQATRSTAFAEEQQRPAGRGT
jgi:methylenetetrahydrofolate reductase (NADPH)